MSEELKNVINTPDTTAEFDAADIENTKILSLFSYLGILLLIPLLACKDSKFARFHVNQGLVLLIAGLIASVIALIPLVGWIVSAVWSIIDLVLVILGIVNAVTGKAKELPIIGKFRILK